MKLNKLNLFEVIHGLKAKNFTSLEVTTACLNQIDELDSEINAFITVTREHALEEAKKADAEIEKHGEKIFNEKPLLGVPYALKDNFCSKGILTTASSNVIKNFIPPYESTVSQRLKDAGAVLLGKTNMDAFAHGSSTESSDFFVTKNPHDKSKLPGGSSGGSAAAVALDMCIFAIGSETAGSIRQPASWCGITGLKPTYGRVSRYGAIAMASSTDSPGPMTKTVKDAALILTVIAGKDDHDATSSDLPLEDYVTLTNHKKDLVVGIAPSYFVEGMEPEVKSKTLETIELIKKLGYTVKEVDLMDPKYSIAVYTILQRSEVSSNLARFDGIRYGFDREHFGFEARKRIMMGTYTLSAGYYDKYYGTAQKVRTLIVDDFKKAFSKVDVIVGPISPCTALTIGASKDNAMFGELQDVLVEPSSIAGITGISINCGYDSHNMPIGFGIMADKFKEGNVLSLAHQLEKALENGNS